MIILFSGVSLCTMCFFFMISLTMHVYEFLNIGVVFPVRNGFQQDLFSPAGTMKLGKNARILNARVVDF